MKLRIFSVLAVLALLAGLLPATAAFADDGGDYEFTGSVESLPADPGWIGDWAVGGTTVHVSGATQIEQEHGPVSVGICVKVEGWLLGDGSVDATKVKTKSAGDCTGGGDGGNSMYGTVETLPGAPGWVGDWVVSGVTVHVTALTNIDQEHGTVAVGAFVEVKGVQQANGSFDANKIEVKMAVGGVDGDTYTKLNGVVETMPAAGMFGDWTVSGRVIHVDNATRIDQEHGAIAVGAQVEVKGWSQADGSIDAVKIEAKSDPSGGDGSHSKFYGFVEQLPAGGLTGNWVVSGVTVTVDSATRIDQEHGPVVLNTFVGIKGWTQADGSVAASEIEVKASAGDSGDNGHISFYGVVESFPAGFNGAWSVSGQTVIVTGTTIINQEHGPIAVVASVEVEGFLAADGSVSATKIEVKVNNGGGDNGGSTGFVKFYGVIEDLPVGGLVGDWMVSGRLVHVTGATVVEQERGTVQLGATVEVKGVQQANGSVDANKVEVKQ